MILSYVCPEIRLPSLLINDDFKLSNLNPYVSEYSLLGKKILGFPLFGDKPGEYIFLHSLRYLCTSLGSALIEIQRHCSRVTLPCHISQGCSSVIYMTPDFREGLKLQFYVLPKSLSVNCKLALSSPPCTCSSVSEFNGSLLLVF